MNIIKSVAAMSLGMLMAVSCASGNSANQATEGELAPAEALRVRLDSVAQSGKVMMGHHDDPVYGHAWAWTFRYA